MKNNLAIIISKDKINAANAGPEGGELRKEIVNNVVIVGVRIAQIETQSSRGLVGVWKLLVSVLAFPRT